MEWSATSLDSITGADGPNAVAIRGCKMESPAKNQTVLDRIDNIQNLLFAIDAVDRERITPLYGATYSVIPALLVPRILWPDKPRTHEGQVLLNVHFGRQDLNSTFTTYVAWGLLPEALRQFWADLGLRDPRIGPGLAFRMDRKPHRAQGRHFPGGVPRLRSSAQSGELIRNGRQRPGDRHVPVDGADHRRLLAVRGPPEGGAA